MKRNTKIILGIVSVIPLIGIIYFLISFFSFFIEISQNMTDLDKEDPFSLFQYFLGPYLIMIFCSLLNFGLIILNVVLAIKDRSASESDKIIWVLLLAFLSIIMHPIFWLVRIWNNPEFSIEDSPTDRSN